ncbi:histidine kinase [Actinoplanes sp. NPDC048796]|uniref:sensor histidine kinase n=1 Tax=unclassified Actinoplanes TaxID=2626549 RepID=UPI0033C9A6FC
MIKGLALRYLWWAETWFTLACLVILGFAVAGLVTGARDGPALGATLVTLALLLGWRRAAVAGWVAGFCAMAVLAVPGLWSGVMAGALQLALTNLFMRRGGKLAVAAAVLTFAELYAVLAVAQAPPGLTATVTLAVWTLGAAGSGAAIRSRQQYIAAIEERARWAVETREAEAQRRVAEERLRIARDLHDVVGHQVAVIKLHTGLARRTLRADADRAEAALREAEAATGTVLREMAGMLRVLRETDEPPAGLAGVEDLVATLRAGGMDIAVEREGDPGRVPDLAGMTAYRVVQELLTNARKHGHGPVELAVRIGGGSLVVEVSNPVAATAAGTPGYGLIGMRERVAAAGGHLSADRRGTMFRATVELPL